MLRMLKTLQAALLQRVKTHHLRAAFDRLAQRFKHARVVGAGVLPEHEDRVAVFEVGEGHAAFADPHALPEGDAAGFVAHVRAVGEVVAAKGADEQLIEVGCFVAGAAGGVELGLVGAFQRL
jgi:hypothetical protein